VPDKTYSITFLQIDELGLYSWKKGLLIM